jgi:hypothetical protein
MCGLQTSNSIVKQQNQMKEEKTTPVFGKTNKPRS